jgi:hypothetical protein
MHTYFIILFAVGIFAQDAVDENALFGDTAAAKPETTLAVPLAPAADKKSVNLSGALVSQVQGGTDRGFWEAKDAAHTSFASGLTGDVMLDARLPRGFKAYGALEAHYQPADSPGTSFLVPELFVDAKLGSRIFIRTGKQVVQWGRCYLWNPTDLINIERKTFEPKIGLREGTYGVKVQAPLDQRFTLYGFAGAQNAAQLDSLSGTVKAEFLVSSTEMGISLWGKRGRGPVFGYDFSTRLLGLDINGEAALYQKFEAKYVVLDSGPLRIADTSRNWVPRAALNVGRTFAVNGVPDRLRAILELYANPAGNSLRAVPLDRLPDSLRVGAGTSSGSSDFIRRIVESGLYEPNSFSKYYAALLISLDRFLVPDLTASLGALGNLTERCAILAAFFSWRPVDGFSLGLNVYGYAGPENTEYTIPGARTRAQLTAKAEF